MPVELIQIRRQAESRGVFLADTTDWCLSRLYALTGNRLEVTIDAICMIPRPDWVSKLIGLRVELETSKK